MKRICKSLISIMAVFMLGIASFSNVFAANIIIENAITGYEDNAKRVVEDFVNKTNAFPITISEDTFTGIKVVVDGRQKALTDVAVLNFDESNPYICKITTADNTVLEAVKDSIKKELTQFTVVLKDAEEEQYLEVSCMSEIDKEMYDKLTNSLQKMYSDAKKAIGTKEEECLNELSSNYATNEDAQRVYAIYDSAIASVEEQRDIAEKEINEAHNNYTRSHQHKGETSTSSEEGSGLSIPFLKDNKRNLYIIGGIAAGIMLILIIIWRKMMPK